MEKETIGNCPVCKSKLISTTLSCKNCDIHLSGEFKLNKYSYLEEDELFFLEKFLSAEGNLKAVQDELEISYFKAKQMLSDILLKLGLKSEPINESVNTPMNSRISYIAVNADDHFVVKLIKSKLNDCGGQATIPLISAGKEATIGFDADGSGLTCDKIPPAKQLTWEVFIAAYDILAMNNGELYKGYARTGKLGSERLPINSLEGYIAHAVHGAKEGDSAFSPGFAIAAVLDWVGVLINERGSTLKAADNIVLVDSYEESLENAVTFNKALDSSEVLRNRLGNFKHWYYFSEKDIFAPSKFIGYKDMSQKSYEAYTAIGHNDINGGIARRRLEKYFSELPEGASEVLFSKLTAFLNQFDSKPSAATKIHVHK